MKRRSFLGLLGAGTVAPTAVLASREEPKFEPCPPTLRREAGRMLTSNEVDDNFKNLHERLLRLEAERH